MRESRAFFFAITLFVLPALSVRAWSGAGHQVIAAEAYRQLSPELKAKVTELLKHHPDYEKWEKSFSADNTNLDLPLFIFMRSSTWADEIRRNGSEYDHPHWHYIDYPLKPPSFPVEPGPAPTDDVLYGIAQCEKVLETTLTSNPVRGASDCIACGMDCSAPRARPALI
jgi:hypothetical protein